MNEYNEGYKAYFDGVCEDDNPYQIGTHAYSSWGKGWNQAYEDESD